jgi:hypothetical protein
VEGGTVDDRSPSGAVASASLSVDDPALNYSTFVLFTLPHSWAMLVSGLFGLPRGSCVQDDSDDHNLPHSTIGR